MTTVLGRRDLSEFFPREVTIIIQVKLFESSKPACARERMFRRSNGAVQKQRNQA